MMSYSIITRVLRGLTKVSFAAGVLLLGLTVSGAQAAIVTVYHDGPGGSLNGGEVGWTAAAGGGPFITENFGTVVNNPPTFADVAFGRIDFGTDPELLGHIHDDIYHDRANEVFPGTPLLTFSPLAALAFGANWDLGPNDPGTGLALFVTFADLTTQLVGTEISNLFEGQFFGIVSDMAILSIELLEGTQGGPLANFETFDMSNARVAAVPIPAALPLFLSAIAALGFLGRRRKQLATA